MSHAKKILVVDDDLTTIKLLESILLAEQYQVFTALDGVDAMIQVKAHMPDLIVLDIMMPEINGYEVCRNLKFDPLYKDIPILLLTVRDQEIDPMVGEKMGISYMQKPIDRAVFLSKLKEVLE